MSEQQTTFDRTDLLPHWELTLMGEERAAKLGAWQSYRACADCAHWAAQPGDVVGGCEAFTAGGLAAPADHSCPDWRSANG